MTYVLNPEMDLDMAHLAMRCIAGHVPDQTEPEYWLVQRRLLQHANRGVEMVKKGLCFRRGWIFHNLGALIADQGRLSDAEAMYERALQGHEEAWGSEHTSMLSTVNNLGLSMLTKAA